MDEQQYNVNRSTRRRRRSRAQIIKEEYLPVIIAGAAIILVLIFIIGAIGRGVEKNRQEKEAAQAAALAAQQEAQRLNQEADALLQKAEALAQSFDYDGAISVLDSFPGDMMKYAQLMSARDKYELEKSRMIPWDDPNKIISLSFQMLIADPERAWNDPGLSTSYNKNFISTTEFTAVLGQLYNNGYILISPYDFIEKTDNAGYQFKTLYLPEGKKPLIITQTDVNYHTYMLDSDGDKLPDKGGDGFASKLLLDADGELVNEYTDKTGNVHVGAYDLVPILNAFVKAHPDFSYKGAKAVISVSGYDGLFGYRTNSEAEQFFGTAAYERSIEDVKAVAQALRNDGYLLACNGFKNESLGNYTAEQISADMSGWSAEVVPILGAVEIFAFPRNKDISEPGIYTGDRYNVLKNLGFTYYLGYCDDGSPWTVFADDYVRQGRIVVSATNLAYHREWFNGMFDSASVLDPTRTTVPK